MKVNVFQKIYTLASGLTMLLRPQYLENASVNLWDGKMLSTDLYY
jgi:hypothetical protein